MRSKGHYPLAINGHRDHVHLFFELKPSVSVSKVAQEVKSVSSKWINENRFVLGNFAWQDGFIGFSYSRSQRNSVIKYIQKQEEHHKVKTFREEYLEFLRLFDIEFDNQYLFD